MAAWTSGGAHCRNEAEDKVTAGEVAELGAEETVNKSFAVKEIDEPLRLLAKL